VAAIGSRAADRAVIGIVGLNIPELRTQRLLVRRLTIADLESCHALYIETGWADSALSVAENRERRRAWLEWTVRCYDELLALTQPPYGERAIVLQDTGEFVGLVGLVPLLAPFGQLPAFGAIAGARFEPAVGMFWSIRPVYQRRGYAAEAAAALAAWAFENLNLVRLVAGTDHDNAASIGVMRRLGMSIQANPYPEPLWFQVVGILKAKRSARPAG
jgi:RimJ/RimL family protein N-acetyltransferase